MYFSFRGKVYLGARTTAGNPGIMNWLGNMPDFTLAFATEETDHVESYSGLDLVDFVQENSRKATFTGTIENYNARNAQILTRSRATTEAAATVTAEALPTGMLAGDSALLVNQNIDPTTVVVHDSATTPAVVAASKYQIDAGGGGITFLDVTGFTQPFHVDYGALGATQLALLTEAAHDYWLRFAGVDKATHSPIVCDLYRVQPKPTSEFGLIHKAQGGWKLDGSALVDPTKDSAGPLGQFGRIIIPTGIV